MRSDFSTVFKGSNPVEIDMIEGLLREEGLAVRVFGTRHGPGAGGAQHIFVLRVEVPRQEEQRARELIEQFLAGDYVGQLVAPEELPEELAGGEEVEPPVEGGSTGTKLRSSTLRPLFAAGVVLVFPGACHVYARRPWTALWIALGEVAALVYLISQPTWVMSMVGACALTALLASDLTGAQLAVKAYNRSKRPSRLVQTLTGVLILALATGFGLVVGPRIPWQPPEIEESVVESRYWLWEGAGYPEEYDLDYPLPGFFFDGVLAGTAFDMQEDVYRFWQAMGYPGGSGLGYPSWGFPFDGVPAGTVFPIETEGSGTVHQSTAPWP